MDDTKKQVEDQAEEALADVAESSVEPMEEVVAEEPAIEIAVKPEVTSTDDADDSEEPPFEETKESLADLEDTDEDTGPVTPIGEAIPLDERGGGKKLKGHIIINKANHPDARWFVVHTTSGHEARIAESLRQRLETMGLENQVFEILIPTQDRVIIRSGKKYTVKEKIFPGYLIVKMILTDEAWLAVRTTQGITGFVGAGTKPSPLSETEVNNIMKFVAAPAARYKVRFSVGEAVKITDGPFSLYLGSISEMDEARGKVKVLINIFGRETPVELDFLQITKA